MIGVGQPAPDFQALATDGRTLSLAGLRGRWVVLYFFPRAFTPGCTIETKRFRDNYPDLQRLGAEVIGVSTDPHTRQCDFAASLQASFPLVGDEDGTIARAYGVLWPLLGVAKRVTFVINPDGVVAALFRHEVQISKHLDDVSRFLERAVADKKRSSPP